MDELAQIESIRKTVPELTQTLMALKQNFKCQYEQERSELDAKVFKLEKKIQDTKLLAEKYKSDLEKLHVKYDDIHEFIYGSRTVTIKKDTNHKAFMKDVCIDTNILEEAEDYQRKL